MDPKQAASQRIDEAGLLGAHRRGDLGHELILALELTGRWGATGSTDQRGGAAELGRGVLGANEPREQTVGVTGAGHFARFIARGAHGVTPSAAS